MGFKSCASGERWSLHLELEVVIPSIARLTPLRLQKMHRQVLILAIAQALFQTASALVVTVGGLAGAQIARAPGLATAPIASMFLGTTLATVPASLWMAARGRRAGFVGGALVGVLGGLIAAAGIALDSLLVFSLGTLLVGAYQGAAQFYRFAASEVADDAFRSRAISLVLAGGVAAALLGPALGKLGAKLLAPMYAGSFLLLALTSLVAAGLLLGVRAPMRKPDESAGEPRAASQSFCASRLTPLRSSLPRRERG